MSEKPTRLNTAPEGYSDWLSELKRHINAAQHGAALAVIRELVVLYWQIETDILARQAQQGWGAKVIDRIAYDLRSAFHEMEGFPLEISSKYVPLLRHGRRRNLCKPPCTIAMRLPSWSLCYLNPYQSK